MKKEQKPVRAYAEVELGTIKKNFGLLSGFARSQLTSFRGGVAMVKADAYGHGLSQVARALEHCPRLIAFGVATLQEAVQLRKSGVSAPIWVFSGSGPLTEEGIALCGLHGLAPVVYNIEALRLILEPSHQRMVRSCGFHLKFNSGMNRLGIAHTEIETVDRLLRKARARPAGFCTHFALAEEPVHHLSRRQVALFGEIVARLAGGMDSPFIHSANTSAILNGHELGITQVCNVVRPGIGLYGYGGARGVKLGLKPSLKLRAQVIENRMLSLAQRVGYGAAFRARRPTPQSVLSIGYADGFIRRLSNGEILVAVGRGSPKLVPVLGRVSMDLTSIGLRLKLGTWVTLLGESGEQGERMAKEAGTIVYEVLTAVSQRVPRVYT